MNTSWLFRMAWRDSRRSRQRLLLFMSAIVLGIAALVAINSFGDNLAQSIDDQARELLGADLVLSANDSTKEKLFYPLLDKVVPTTSRKLNNQSLVVTSPYEYTREISFASMVSFPKSQGVRLAQVKHLSPGDYGGGGSNDYPYYGQWQIIPQSAEKLWRSNLHRAPKTNYALVDDGLMIQFGAKVGDSVNVGGTSYKIIGRVLKTPGQSAVTTTVAPTVFLPFVAEGLIQRGSRVNYKYYFRFDTDRDVEKIAKRIGPALEKVGVSYDTVEGRKKQTGRSFADLTKYLSLVAFVALLLGCVGVASAVQLYVKEKVTSVAILRTLGASGRQAFLIYLLQTALMGLIGAIIGALLGSIVQLVLPRVFGNFLPITVETALSGPAILGGIGTGLLISVLFSLLPLLAIRNVSDRKSVV